MNKTTTPPPFPLRLRTLTPLHIGDGSQLHSLDYVIWKNRLYRTPQKVFDNFLKKISSDDSTKMVENAEKFMEWAEDLTLKMETVERERKNTRPGQPGARDFNQTMRDLRNAYSLLAYARKIGQESALTELLQDTNVVSLPVQTPDRMKQEVRGFQRGADGRAYLPGSSLKGCIRTALLFHYLENHANETTIKKILEQSLEQAREVQKKGRGSLEKIKKNFAVSIEHEALFCPMKTERGLEKAGEEHNDLLRLLRVSDAALPTDRLGVENIDLYLVKKQPRGSRYPLAAERQTQAPAAESVLPGTDFTALLDFDAELLLRLHKIPGDGGVMVGKERHFIGWRRKVAALFGISQELLEQSNNSAIREQARNHVFACIRKFSDAQAAAFDRWQKHLRDNDRRGEFTQGIEVGASKVLSRAGVLRFHLGYATGFEGMTELLHLAVFHKPIFKEIMELFGIGDKPGASRNRKPGETYKADPTNFPKSRRMATRAGEIAPFGWLEWADDPAASVHQAALQAGALEKTPATPASVETPVAPPKPRFLKGTVKQGAVVDAEIVACGVPNRLKLFIREGYTPTLELRYGTGFKPEDLGRLVTVRISGVRGKEDVIAVQFVGFR